MKKIISIVLLLAMVLGMFAACNNQPATEPAGSDLDAAAAYLKNMYDKSTKDEDNKLTADKELIPAVTIGGVSYPVTWSIQVTAGPANAIVMAQGASAGTQKIDIVEQPEEEVRFVLTATISDGKGNTKTLDLKFYSPAVQKVEVTEGQKVVIYLVADGKYMTGIDYLYTSSSGSQKHELALTTEKAEAVALTLKTNADGTVSFVADNGMFLFCDATNVQFVSEEGDFTKFVLEAAEGGQYIKCAVANYSGKPQYLEVYSGYMTCYGISDSSNLALYIFELQDATGAMGTVGAPATPCEHTYADGVCTQCGASDPNYVPPVGPQLPEVTAPAAGTAYRFGLIQVANGTTVYVTGETTDRYLVTTTDINAAADVYVEEADGGYKFYILVDGAKSYIYIYNNDSGKRSVGYGAEGNVFVFNAECGNWVTTFDGKECYLGSYNNFETVSVSDTTYIDASNAGISQYPAGFFNLPGDVPADLAGQIAAAGSLANGEYLPYTSTITGTIIDEPKPSSRTEGQFKFTVSDGTNTILCYYVPVTGGTPVTGDTVTVTGYLTAYNGSAQFDETAAAVLEGEDLPVDPSAPFANGDQIVIYATAHNKALSTLPSSEGSFYQMGVDVTVSGGTVTGFAATEIWTVIDNGDGTFSFSYNGQKLAMQDSYSSMSLGAANDKWELIALSNGSYALKNVARGNYIEWYASKNNWSTYTTDDLLSNDLFHLSFFIVG